jgi:uncharacterized protein
MIHVADLTRALCFVAKQESATKQIYFAANRQPISIGEIFRLIGRAIGADAGNIPMGFATSPVRSIRHKLPLQLQNLFCDVLAASSEKLEALGFACEMDPYEGILKTAHWHFAQNKKEAELAVVTGGAGGIGKALSEQFYGRGFQVAIIDTDKEAAKQLADKIGAEILIADLSTEDGRAEAEAFCDQRGQEISVWVNNAGIGRRGNFVEMPLADTEKIYQLNCITPVVLSRRILDEFKKRGKGILVNMASSAAFQPLPYMAVYAASKSFLASFSLALEKEMQKISKNIRVLTIFPSGTATQFQKTAGVSENDRHKLLDSYDVARHVMALIHRKTKASIVGWPATWMFLFSKFCPMRFQGMIWEKMMREYR